MFGAWDHSVPRTYGTPASYLAAAEFLDRYCETVEDWGCGQAGAKPYFKKSQYVGIDGSKSKGADKIVDLRRYTSSPDGILLRHVLEHNYDWPMILRNALASFQKRLVIVFFLPPEEQGRMFFVNKNGVPNLVLGRDCFLGFLKGLKFDEQSIPRRDESGHPEERLFRFVR